MSAFARAMRASLIALNWAAFGRPLQNGALAVAAPAAGLAADLDRAVVDFEAGWAACFAGAAIAATHAVEISSSVTEKRATMRDGFTVPPVRLRTIGKRGGLGIGATEGANADACSATRRVEAGDVSPVGEAAQPRPRRARRIGAASVPEGCPTASGT